MNARGKFTLPFNFGTLPLAVLLSLGSGVAGAYVGLASTHATLSSRTDAAEYRISNLQKQLTAGYVERGEFNVSLQDLKHELDEIRDDVKELRRRR